MPAAARSMSDVTTPWLAHGHFADASDPVLVMSIARFERDALAEVFRRHGRVLSTVAARKAGGAEPADDVVVDIFVRLWRRPELFDPARGSLRSYLLGQARGRAARSGDTRAT